MDFESFVKDIEKNSLNVYGVEVYEDGLLTNAYGDTDNLYDYIILRLKFLLFDALCRNVSFLTHSVSKMKDWKPLNFTHCKLL